MTALQWSEALALGLDFMDDTHREFVELLAACARADDAALAAAWDALVDHTDRHFAQEDRWMERTGFSSTNCHSTQHRVVLQVLREGAAQLAAGNRAPARQMVRELALWFPQHAQTMDAALALHLRGVGFDAATGEVRRPEALAEAPIHGCGGVYCSTP